MMSTLFYGLTSELRGWSSERSITCTSEKAGKMRFPIFILFIVLTSIKSNSQHLKIITSDRSTVVVTIMDRMAKDLALKDFKGIQDNNLRKKLTARTYRLTDGRVIVEFFDRQGIAIGSMEDFEKLAEVIFVKNNVWKLKKNLSYKIEITPELAAVILQHEKTKRLPFESESPADFTIDVYELSTGQLLYVEKSGVRQWQTLFPDMKTLASENLVIGEQYYSSKREEDEMKLLANGDPLDDFEPNEHQVYPKYLDPIIKNHELTLLQKEVYVSPFYSNLYQSKKGYFVLIQEVNQKNGAGDKMPILSLGIYKSIEEIKVLQERYEKYKNEGSWSEHLFHKVSKMYGANFPNHVAQLIKQLPNLLNFDTDQLSMDFEGLKIIDEAIKWNATNYALFDDWFPSALAYYGQFYIQNKYKGRWAVTFDSEHNVWIPVVLLPDGTPAFDSNEFCKSMYEGPIPMEWGLR